MLAKLALCRTAALGARHYRYLVSAAALRSAYREQFLAGLERLRREGKLRLQGEYAALRDEGNWSVFVARLRSTEWVS